MDDRVRKLAKLIVGYSIRIKRGDTVVVSSGTVAEPLVLCLYEEILRKGAFPVIKMVPDAAGEIFYRAGKKSHFTTVTPYQRAVTRLADAVIFIYDEKDTRLLEDVDPRKQALYGRTLHPLAEIRRKKPWLITLYPTKAYAKDAGMSLREYEDFFYGAVFADRKDPIAEWKKLSRRQAKIISRLKAADEVRIVGDGTDLRLSVKGRKFINSDGSSHNMPSGEVFTAPIESSAEGYIKYDFPVCYSGREISGIRLVFRKGLVVEASAEKNNRFLQAMLDTDRGARRLGELGIGTNRRINRFTRRILLDEKIGGTVHLALGRSILESGGKNRSAIHWDMIKDLRQEGAVYVDGKRLRV